MKNAKNSSTIVNAFHSCFNFSFWEINQILNVYDVYVLQNYNLI